MAEHDSTETETLRRIDPRNLIREAYRMEGLGPGECRSIFLDWAIGQPMEADVTAFISELLDHYGARDGGSGDDAAEHPMTAVLREGLDARAAAPRRRGGARGRER